MKRVLEYDIDIRFSIRFHPDGSAANPPSPPGNDGDSDDSQHRRRSRRLRSPSPPRPPSLDADCAPGVSGAGGPVQTWVASAEASVVPSSALPGLVFVSQVATSVPRVLPAVELLNNKSSCNSEGEGTVEFPVLRTMVGRRLSVAASFSLVEAAPSLISPTLECFQILKDTVLPWPDGGLGSSSTTVGILSKLGPSQTPKVDDGLGLGKATESPASPRSPLLFPTTEATVEPASLQSPSSPIPEFNLLVTPQPQPKILAKPLLVYSRRRSRCAAKPLLVYSRRRPRRSSRGPSPTSSPAVDVAAAPVPLAADVVADCTAPSPAVLVDATTASLAGMGCSYSLATLTSGSPSSLVDAQAAFLDKVARRAGGLLPAPSINKRRGKILPSSATPRRSRRLAGAKIEFGLNDMERRTKKKAMRTLELIEEHEGIDQQALDEYSKLFTQPLPDSHVQALAALFNWSLPDALVWMTVVCCGLKPPCVFFGSFGHACN